MVQPDLILCRHPFGRQEPPDLDTSCEMVIYRQQTLTKDFPILTYTILTISNLNLKVTHNYNQTTSSTYKMPRKSARV